MVEQIGGYPIAEVIGAGGFGTVYRATDPTSGAPVAVKVLDNPDEQWRRDLLRSEAEAMLAVDHPNCVRLVDVIDEPDTAAIVSEFIHGVSLRSLLEQQGALDGPQSLGVLEGALAGLAAVHYVGLVHADIKPDNVVLDADGQSRLIDFGLASPPREVLGEDGFLGTPPYISPEQVSAGRVDVRSDIYSTAIMLFELLCGSVPYRGTSAWQTARLHVDAQPPDPRSIVADIGAPLADLCLMNLAKDPDARHQNAVAFHTALNAAATERFGTDWRARSGIAAAVAGVVAAGVPAGAALLGGGAAGATATVIGAAGSVTALGTSASAFAGGTMGSTVGGAAATASTAGSTAGQLGAGAGHVASTGGSAGSSVFGGNVGATASSSAATNTGASVASQTGIGALVGKGALAVGAVSVAVGGAYVGVDALRGGDGGEVVVESGFDDSTEEWRTENDATDFDHVADGGNPDGHVVAADIGTGATWYFASPENWAGDRSDAVGGTLEFDLIMLNGNGGFDDRDVIIRTDDGREIYFDLDDEPGTEWTSFSVPLDGDGWVDAASGDEIDDADLEEILGQVDVVLIRGEYSLGADSAGLDNVVIRD